MEKVRSANHGLANVTTITLVLAMFVATTGYTQVRDHNGNLELEEIQASEVTAAGLKQSVMQLSGSYEIRRPIGEIYNREPWSDPSINFLPGGINIPAGDLNGDGINDVVRHYYNQLDPRDNDPGTLADRTLVFLSGTSLVEPDHILYDIAFPVGDVNGDGKANLISRDIFGSPTIYSFGESGISTAPLVLSHDFQGTTSTITSTQFSTDLDGSGFSDVLFTASSVIQNKSFFVLFGASDASGFELRSYEISDFETEYCSNLSPTNLRIPDKFTYNGRAYVLLDAWERFTLNRCALIISFDGNRNGFIVQDIPIAKSNAWNVVRAFTAVLETGLPLSLVMVNANFDGDKSIYYPIENGSYLFSTEPLSLHSQEVWPVGDLRNDGAMSFVTREVDGGPYKVASLTSGPASGLVFGSELPDQATGNNYIIDPNSLRRITTYGDLTGDGTEDHVFYYTNPTENGYLLIRGGEAITFTKEIIDPDQYGTSQASDVYALGDVTGNGADDFAVYYIGTTSNNLVFFEGGSNWQTPVRTWDLTKDITVRDVISGNFFDANRLDIVVLTSETVEPGSNQFESVVSVYQGGGFPDRAPIRSVRKEDVYPGITLTVNNVLGTMANAGDVNNSGLDDLLIASASLRDPALGPLPATLYLGGPGFLNGAPDVSFSFPDQDLGFGIGGTLAGLGDINGDGIDDFAIVNIDEGGVADGQAYGVVGGGRIHVFFGRDGNVNFGQPDLTLLPDTATMAAGYNMRYLGMSEIATGDFNGDGFRGIAAKSFVHNTRNFNEGVPGVHIFNKPMSGNQPDQLLPLHNSIMSLTASDYPYVPFLGRMLMTGIPDLTSNGRDELLMIGVGSGATNAVLHYGRNRFSDFPDVVFEAPNRSVSMGAQGSFINRHYRTPVGDFNGDGKLNFLVAQPADANFRDTPVYMYELGRPGGVQVTKTESVGSTGGTIEVEETGTKVVIPAGAIDEQIDIEVGTFTVVPEGAAISGAMIYLGPPGTTFSEPVEITVSYDPENLPEGVENEEDLVLLRYDETTSEWEELPSEVNTTDKTVTGTTMRFSGFGAGVIKSTVNIEREREQLPAQVQLHQNYPNPFNPTTRIEFVIPETSNVTLEVFNIQGQRVATLVDGIREAGVHTVNFDAANLASGVYMYRLQAGDFTKVNKMMLVK